MKKTIKSSKYDGHLTLQETEKIKTNLHKKYKINMPILEF